MAYRRSKRHLLLCLSRPAWWLLCRRADNGVEKTRLSRRVAALEKRLGVRLLQRTTRALALTDAGRHFFDRCVVTVEGAQAAYDSVAELRKEPAGVVRLSSPVLLAQRCLAQRFRVYDGESKGFRIPRID
jgi:DNA-binding transcriptional LysR family regulator